MSEWKSFVRVLKYPQSDVAVLLSTFFLTVLIDLTIAIEVGVVLSAFLFVRRMEETAGVSILTDELRKNGANEQPDSARDFSRAGIPDGVEVFEAFGPIFFSAIERFSNALASFERAPKVLILYMPRVAALDGSGIRAIERVHERALRDSSVLLIAGAERQPLKALLRSEAIPNERILKTLPEALQIARELLNTTPKKPAL